MGNLSLTEYGYHRPTEAEILEDKIQLAKELFGEDIDTGEQTPLGKYIRIGAYDLSKAYEDLEFIYYARFPNTATGISLDRLCVFAGISRNPATYAEYTLTVTGEAETEVDELIVCGEDTEIVFHNIEPFVLDESGAASVVVECETAGTVGNGITITEIVNPMAGIEGISSSSQTKAAEDIESDYYLRRRFSQAVEGAGGSNTNAIRAALLRVSSVKSVTVIENATDTPDEDGRPPHSFECYVSAGADAEYEIAMAIFDKKPVGIQTIGDKEVTIIDVSGNEQIVRYSPTSDITVHVKIAIKTDETFPTEGMTQIQDNVTAYINSHVLGQSLILSSIYGHIYSVTGVTEVTTLQLSTDGASYSSGNITVPKYAAVICAGVSVEAVE